MRAVIGQDREIAGWGSRLKLRRSPQPPPIQRASVSVSVFEFVFEGG